ncbi:hypothetical protein HY214_03215 [Candidatus Roizmanbacteria bacterium]|nr:hypothetical protein [Candidatus Roizmanbacteria bacterium]
MELTPEQISLLKDLMTRSAKKGNLANAGLVLENNKLLASAESWVASSCDATAHSERMLVTMVCNLKHANYTPGLIMVSVVEPCTMCMSACSQAGLKKIAYIIPAKRFIEKIAWMSDTTKIDKHQLASQYSEPLKLVHLSNYEEEFCQIFEKVMSHLLK